MQKIQSLIPSNEMQRVFAIDMQCSLLGKGIDYAQPPSIWMVMVISFAWLHNQRVRFCPPMAIGQSKVQAPRTYGVGLENCRTA